MTAIVGISDMTGRHTWPQLIKAAEKKAKCRVVNSGVLPENGYDYLQMEDGTTLYALSESLASRVWNPRTAKWKLEYIGHVYCFTNFPEEK